ncbi:MAG TPA: hypothetical protein VND21_05685 [Planctomycetota bacterium]|nr:hypothetical protein [Planctomycetota bacterium]
MSTLGRALQLFGLILLPAALVYGTTSDRPDALGVELTGLAVGALAFFLGTRLLARR